MSIASDPLFIAAEVQWRFDTNSALYHGAKPVRHRKGEGQVGIRGGEN